MTIILKERVKNLGGRPVGTSIQDQMRKKEVYVRMMNEISQNTMMQDVKIEIYIFSIILLGKKILCG